MFTNRKEGNRNCTLVAIGANLPAADGCSPLQICDRAVRRLAALPGISRLVMSRWFSSAPVPASDQPRYINGVARLACALSPEALLAELQGLEQAEGRSRTVPNAPRTLDLDIIDMVGLVRGEVDPLLPHPRAHLRAFVLLPLRDIAPHWIHPASGASLATLIASLPPQDIHPTP